MEIDDQGFTLSRVNLVVLCEVWWDSLRASWYRVNSLEACLGTGFASEMREPATYAILELDHDWEIPA